MAMVKILSDRVKNGVREIVFWHTADDEPKLEKCGINYLLKLCPWVISVRAGAAKEGGRETIVSFPVMNLVNVRYCDMWKPFFFVHADYGTGIRDCVRLGVDAWRSAGMGVPELAFVSKLPKGVESGVEVSGCYLFEAEWMMAGCVAVGL